MHISTDRIEKTILLRVPRSRAWRAIATPKEFGAWFGVEIEGKFVPGASVTGRLLHPDYAGYPWDVTIERVEPESFFSFHWHPYAVDLARDYSSEPATLVEFRLEDAPDGTRLTVVESGFDNIPLERRAEAWRMNESGWAIQLENIARHVSK